MKFDVNSFMHGALAQNADNLELNQTERDDFGGYQDIKFEGVLCSATCFSETGERTFFSVDPRTGEALTSYSVSQPNLQFGVTTEFQVKAQVIESKETKVKPDVVNVIRYFRRYNFRLQQIESSGGLTVGVLMDYKQGLMQVFPAFCAPTDNFSKEIVLIMLARHTCTVEVVSSSLTKPSLSKTI